MNQQASNKKEQLSAQQISAPKPKSSKGLIIVLAILGIFVLISIVGTGAYMLGKKAGRKNADEQKDEGNLSATTTTTSTTVSTLTTTTTIPAPADPYEGWEIYSNDEWGISFKHNGCGENQLDVDNPDATGHNVVRIAGTVNKDYHNEIVIQWGMWENKELLELNEFYDKYQAYKTGCTVDKNFKINSKPVINALCPNEPTGVPVTEVYIMDSQKRVFIITYLHYLQEDLMEITDLSIQTINVQ